jgi:hypothetical protein
MFEPIPAKPKGMQLRTYWRLLLKYERALECPWPPWLLNAISREATSKNERRFRRKKGLKFSF